MDQELWSWLKEVLSHALEVSPSRRLAVVDELCLGDTSMASLAKSIIRSDIVAATEDWWPLRSASASSEPRPKTTRFQVAERLGSGGFGVVYRARDLLSGGWRALKSLRVVGKESVLRFEQEYLAASRVHCPNVVSVYDLFLEEHQAFFSMELVRGRPIVEALRARLSPGTRLRDAQLANICHALGQITAAVGAVHRVGLIHCDLKPSNVLLTPERRVVILDFGLAVDSRAPRKVERCRWGTPEYMAPEQVGPKGPCEASDWFTVGALLFESLTGHRHPSSVFASREGAARNPSSLAAGIPKELDRLCAALLEPIAKYRPSEREILAILVATRKTRGRLGDQYWRERAASKDYVATSPRTALTRK